MAEALLSPTSRAGGPDPELINTELYGDLVMSLKAFDPERHRRVIGTGYGRR